MVGFTKNADPGLAAQVKARRLSVNDLIRGEMKRLLGRTDLSMDDRRRLDGHFTAIRDIEVTLTGALAPDTAANLKDVGTMAGGTPKYYNNDFAELTMGVQMDLMAFAASSGYSKTAVLKIGDRSDNFNWPLPGFPRINFHKIAHRSESGLGDSATRIQGAHEMHYLIDRIYMRLFKRFLDRMAAMSTPQGPLLDQGFVAYTNQNANGWHNFNPIPWIIAGNAGGYLQTGRFMSLPSQVQPQPAVQQPAGGGGGHQARRIAGRRLRRRRAAQGALERSPRSLKRLCCLLLASWALPAAAQPGSGPWNAVPLSDLRVGIADVDITPAPGTRAGRVQQPRRPLDRRPRSPARHRGGVRRRPGARGHRRRRPAEPAPGRRRGHRRRHRTRGKHPPAARAAQCLAHPCRAQPGEEWPGSGRTGDRTGDKNRRCRGPGRPSRAAGESGLWRGNDRLQHQPPGHRPRRQGEGGAESSGDRGPAGQGPAHRPRRRCCTRRGDQ